MSKEILLGLIALLLLKAPPIHADCICRESGMEVLKFSCQNGGMIDFFISYNCSLTPFEVKNVSITSISPMPVKFGLGGLSIFANVDFISLSSNYLTSLPNFVFDSLGSLQKLDLSYNNFSSIRPEVFTTQFSSLVFLNLSHNFLTSLPNDFLSKFIRLSILDLSNNLFKSLPPDRPVNWPSGLTLMINNNNFPLCWTMSNGTGLTKQGLWWCDGYTRTVIGDYQESVSISCNTSESSVWVSPKNNVYQIVNRSSQWEHFFPSHFHASAVTVGGAAELKIDGLRPFFSGVWSCLQLKRTGNRTLITVVSQVMLVCRSKLQEVYHWSLIVSAACTVVMVLTGLLSALIRLLWMTRCFTQKVHVVDALSLHDLQYSPRFAEQRHTIMRQISEQRRLEHSNSWDPSISSTDSFTPAWLPPHRQRSVDPFAHGGGPITSDEDSECDGYIDTSDEEGDDTMENDEHRTRSRVDEFRDRFRRDMVKRVDHVRSRMREQRHSMEESTSKVMRSLKSGSSNAASKMRSGLYNSVESVKFQVKSVTEFCGTGSARVGQTVSVATLDTDVDTQTTTERRIIDVTAV